MPLFAPTFVFQWGCVYPTPLPWKRCSGVRLLDQTSSSLQVFWRLISSLDELGIDFYQQQTSSEEPFCLFNMGQVHLCSHMIKFSSFVSTLALFFLPLSHLTKLNCFLIQHLPALCYFLVLDCLTSKSVQASQHHLQWVTLIVYTIFLLNSAKKCCIILSNSLDDGFLTTIVLLFFCSQSMNLLAQVFVNFLPFYSCFWHGTCMNNSWTFKDWVHGFWSWDGDIEMLFYII